jgi:outer membrane lipoprotein-sorting protein
MLVVLMIAAMTAQAQYDQKAKTILDAMSARYKMTPSYVAKFSTALVNETEGLNEVFEGQITVKSDQYMLKTEEQEVINDGTTVWTYLPDVNEVNIDTYAPDDDEITPSSIFDEYKNGYKYIWLENSKEQGFDCDVIDLIPEDAVNAQFFKIKMVISSKDRTLLKWTMFEKQGNKYIYTISDFDDKAAVADAIFKFDKSKYPGVEIVDLR